MNKLFCKFTYTYAMLFNIVFQPKLEEAYATWEYLKVRLLNFGGCEWSMGHLEYADDLFLITNPISHAENFLRICKLILDKYAMEMVHKEIVWVYVGSNIE